MARTVMAGMWNVHRLTATVINDVAVEVAFFTLWATGKLGAFLAGDVDF
jgi:hypothetical protein